MALYRRDCRSSSSRRLDLDIPNALDSGKERERAPAVFQTRACRSRRRGVQMDSRSRVAADCEMYAELVVPPD